MTFAEPRWFWALLLIPLLAGLFTWNEHRSRELLRKLVAARLESHLAGAVSLARRRVRFLLLLLGIACVIVSLARPQLGYTWEQSKRKGRDVLLAVDTSKSMLATDLSPNRLTRARLAVQDLLALLPGDRVGLIAFAGGAFLQAPLTIDYSAVLSSVAELDTELIPRGGTNITEALKVAAEAFGKGESEHRALILFTDGEELEKNAVEAARAQAANFRVFAVGVGTAEGSIIPQPGTDGGTEFVKDSKGQIVKSRLDETRLKEIAEASGGFYVRLADGPATMRRIVNDGLGSMKEQEIDARQSRRPIERYQWPLGLGLIFLTCSMFIRDRKGRAASGVRPAMAALVFALLVGSAQARSTGADLYREKRYDEAHQAFQQELQKKPESDALQFNQGAASYQLGKYDEAVSAFSRALVTPNQSLREKAEYNLGTALLKRALSVPKSARKDLENAIQHFDETLKSNPAHSDAKTNREIARQKLEELKKQEEKKDDQQDDQQKQEPSKDKKDPSEDQQSKGGDDKKEKPQDSKGGQPDQKNEPKPGEEPKDGKADQHKDGAGSDSPQDKPGEQPKDKPSDGSGEQQQASETQPSAKPHSKNEQDKQDAEQQENASATPGPVPSPSDKKLSGDLQSAGSEGAEKQDANAEPQLAEEAAREGEMSERQAVMLLDSLAGEDDRVRLDERRKSAPVLNDW